MPLQRHRNMNIYQKRKMYTLLKKICYCSKAGAKNRVLPLMGARELAVFINGNISELFKETGY